jgi:pimeloyl-ACP methyl ester carboxylesterase
LVGWSYAGYIISDYVRRKGKGKIAGINFVEAAVVLNQKAFGTLVGPGFLDNAPALVRTTFRPTLRQFVVYYAPASSSQSRRTISRKSWLSTWLLNPNVRGALLQRELDFGSLLEGIAVPVLVTHGRSDNLVLPAMADYILSHCKNAQVSWYEGVGHVPFLEEPLRFNTELKRFALSAYA